MSTTEKEDRTMSTYTAVTAPTQFVESNGVILRVIKIDEVSTVGQSTRTSSFDFGGGI
jgi:hypothetical protein